MIDCLVMIPLTLTMLTACKLEPPKTVQVTEKNTGGTVKLDKGDILEVALIGNPSTGFNWEIQFLDTAVIRQKGEMTFKADRDEPGFAGSPGTITMNFEAVGSGETNLLLVYHRPWEKETPPIQTYKLTVKVK
jgi:inhibitor of cysteine peptidase